MELSTAAIAVDGGNSKTEAMLIAASGEVLASTRGPGFRPQIDGVEAAMAVLTGVVGALDAPGRVALISAYLAGADLPAEEEELHARVAAAGWARRTVIGNDTIALLRSGAPERWGVAVVCGAGINAVGLAPDGRIARFPALGELTGDWGGGDGVMRAGIWSAVRGEDGRGPATALSERIATSFAMRTVLDVSLAVHTGALGWPDLRPITRLVFEVAAEGDDVAVGIVERLAAEITAMAAVLIERLALGDVEVPLVLGGGVIRAGHALLDQLLTDKIGERELKVSRRLPAVAPVFGAALLALDELGAGADAEARLLAADQAP
jgi:N-acetylglucosamine kinase-like BadF-type ATPase